MGIVNSKKIMIATDGSDCSKQAVDKGIEFGYFCTTPRKGILRLNKYLNLDF